MPLFQGFRPVVGTICPSSAAAVVGPPRASQGMKKGRRPRRRPRLKLSDRAGPDQCPVPGENALFPAQIAGFLAVSRPVPVYPVFLNYVVPVHSSTSILRRRHPWPGGGAPLRGAFFMLGADMRQKAVGQSPTALERIRPIRSGDRRPGGSRPSSPDNGAQRACCRMPA